MEGTSCAVLQAVNETLLVAQVKIVWNGNMSWCALSWIDLRLPGALWLGLFWQLSCTFYPCRHLQSSHGADRDGTV